MTNKPFEFRCTVEGTSSELSGATIKWQGPDGKGKEITITGNDAYGNITLERGRSVVNRIELMINRIETKLSEGRKNKFRINKTS